MARLTLEIPDSLQQTLTEEAQAHGLSLEYWVLQLLRDRRNRPVWLSPDQLSPEQQAQRAEQAIQLLQSWIDAAEEEPDLEPINPPHVNFPRVFTLRQDWAGQLKAPGQTALDLQHQALNWRGESCFS
ncbi:MAG: hypothetical protein ACO331_00865 [Prochlorothrix sp.]